MENDVCFKVYNIYLKVYIPWVYNINGMGLILFPWGFSINPLGLGLLYPWVIISIPWFY